MARISTWMKEHLKAALAAVGVSCTLLGSAIGGVVTYFATMEQSRVDRFADNLMDEYRGVAESKRELYMAIDKFTLALSEGAEPDPVTVEKLDEQLLDLHQRIDLFSLGLDATDEQKVSDVKNALADLKIQAANVRTRADLPYFAGRVAEFEAAFKAARPIVERKIGTPTEMFSG